MGVIPGTDFKDLTSEGDEYDENGNRRKKGRSLSDDFKTAKKIAKKIYDKIGPNYTLFVVIGVIVVVVIILILEPSGMSFLPNRGGDNASIEVIPPDSPRIVIPGLEILLDGPGTIENSENLIYTVTVNYSATSPPISRITIYTKLPPNTSFDSATGAYTFENGEISWPMGQNERTFSFTLRPTVPDIEIKNAVYARLAPPGIGSATTPSADSCGGKYYLASTPVGANFGDPACNFTKDELYALLKSVDPANADKWYIQIIPCESSYNPNAYNAGAVDAAGAWGLYQMGRGKNGQYDHGDVDWESQTVNAVTYNRDLIGGSFGYWACG